MAEGFERQRLPLGCRRTTVGEGCGDRGVIGRIADHGHRFKVLGCRTQQGDTADIDLFDGVGNRHARLGNEQVGGNLAIKGTTTFQGAVGINSNLAVRGSLSVGGVLSAGSLNVGSLGVSTINISGNLNFAGHIVPSGASPSVKSSVAANGGSVTIDGNDTAGTITINIGSGAVLPGELAIINFRSAFTGTPKVQLTPINSQASALNYYATRSPTFFTVETSSPPVAGASYVFDYLITQ